ncbi:MAG: hypothetical protein ACNA7J_13325 [Wenzhouxiangella sp.]
MTGRLHRGDRGVFLHADTECASRTPIPANSRRHARLQALNSVCQPLAREAEARGLETYPLRKAAAQAR